MGESSAHALLSPSGAETWMNCAGSLAMQEGIPSRDSEFSAEGTAAHDLASRVLLAPPIGERLSEAADFIGEVIRVGQYQFTVDEDMAAHVQVYVDNVRDYADLGELFVEQKLSIEHLTGEKDAKGTSDAVVLVEAEINELIVVDLKYGQGVQVYAKENKQLMIYALGALEQYSGMFTPARVRLVIHQPRLSHLDEWDCSVEELLAFGEQVKARAREAIAARAAKAHWLGKNTSFLRVTDKGCLWCKAKANCPAAAQHVQDVVGADFDAITDPIGATVDVQALVTPSTHEVPPELTGEQITPDNVKAVNLGKKLDACAFIESWIKAVRAQVELDLLAGRKVIGVDGDYKLVQGRQGARAWSDDTEAEAALKKIKLKVDEMYTKKLKSPTAIEKVLKDSPKKWEPLQALIGRSEGKLSVASALDKRPAATPAAVEGDFDAVPPAPVAVATDDFC